MERRVALIAPSASYVGPALARSLAARDHDLVLASPSEDLVRELEAAGCTVAAVPDAGDLAEPDTCERLVAAALERFGRLDAACMFSGAILLGRFLDTTVDDLHHIARGNLDAPYQFLQAVVGPMVERGDGQVLVITSATAARPHQERRCTPPHVRRPRCWSAMSLPSTPATVSRSMPSARTSWTSRSSCRANGIADDPERRARVEAMVPVGRLGTMEEFASFCSVLLDGTSRFQTGQFFSYSGGWSD